MSSSLFRLWPCSVGLALTACNQVPEDPCQGSQAIGEGPFAECAMPTALHLGGYIDSTFINKSGDRFYFIHSVFSPSVLSGQSSPKHCDHVQAELLPGHITTDGLEWNTDIYYVEWDGESWSEPINLGEPINSLGMECCMWLNDDETEIIYNTVSNLDGDEEDEDLGLPPTGNYRATRADRDSPWSDPEPLPGVYGIEEQAWDHGRHDLQKVPSGNLYLWEKTPEGDNLLVFGERTGGADDEPSYASPATISGTTNYETQLWVNDAETRLVFNHRQADEETEIYTRERATDSDAWADPTTVSTPGFADEAGNNIWGELSFDQTESFMILTRFNTSDSTCWTPDLLVTHGDVDSGFGTPTVLN